MVTKTLFVINSDFELFEIATAGESEARVTVLPTPQQVQALQISRDKSARYWFVNPHDGVCGNPEKVVWSFDKTKLAKHLQAWAMKEVVSLETRTTKIKQWLFDLELNYDLEPIA